MTGTDKTITKTSAKGGWNNVHGLPLMRSSANLS